MASPGESCNNSESSWIGLGRKSSKNSTRTLTERIERSKQECRFRQAAGLGRIRNTLRWSRNVQVAPAAVRKSQARNLKVAATACGHTFKSLSLRQAVTLDAGGFDFSLLPTVLRLLVFCRVKVERVVLPDVPLEGELFEDRPGPVRIFTIGLSIDELADFLVGKAGPGGLLHHLKDFQFHNLQTRDSKPEASR